MSHPTVKDVERSARNRRLLLALKSEDTAGAEAAFRAVYEAEKGFVYGYLLRLCGDPHATADLFQNVWLKLARHARQLRDDSELRAWLCTVARREFVSYRRAQVVDLSRLLTLGLHTPSPEVHGDWSRMELDRALQQLSDADRELLLTIAAELEAHEAAAALGVSDATLRQRLARARRRLRERLDDCATTRSTPARAEREGR